MAEPLLNMWWKGSIIILLVIVLNTSAIKIGAGYTAAASKAVDGDDAK